MRLATLCVDRTTAAARVDDEHAVLIEPYAGPADTHGRAVRTTAAPLASPRRLACSSLSSKPRS